MARSEYKKMFEAETSYFWFVAKHGLAARLVKRLGLGRDSQVLDLGCGTGINLKQMQNAGFAIGLDYFPEAFQYCLARSLTDLVLSKGEVLPFKANSFDLITSLDTIEHSEDGEGLLKEVSRALKPGGYFLMTAPAYPSLFGAHDFALGHKQRFSKANLLEMLAQAGFKIELCGNYFGLVFPAAVMLKLFQKQFGSRTETISYHLPFPLNQIFLAACRLETWFFPYFQMPFGTTLVALCRKGQNAGT